MAPWVQCSLSKDGLSPKPQDPPAQQLTPVTQVQNRLRQIEGFFQPAEWQALSYISGKTPHSGQWNLGILKTEVDFASKAVSFSVSKHRRQDW